MRILKIIGIVFLSILFVFAALQFIFVTLAIVMAVAKNTGANLSYMLGQMAGSIIMLLLFGAGVRALRRNLRRNQAPENTDQ